MVEAFVLWIAAFAIFFLLFIWRAVREESRPTVGESIHAA
jgi:hypothetical protein